MHSSWFGKRDSTRLKVKDKQTLPFSEFNRKQAFLRGRTLRASFLKFSITDAGVRVGVLIVVKDDLCSMPHSAVFLTSFVASSANAVAVLPLLHNSVINASRQLLLG